MRRAGTRAAALIRSTRRRNVIGGCKFHIVQPCAAAGFLIFAGSPAFAQAPLVHLPLDGSIANQGGAGAAQLIVPDGADRPAFVAGAIGQGLLFGKGGVIAIPYQFDQADHPRATITMWVKIDDDRHFERELFSLGPGNGLLLTVTGTSRVRVRSARSATHEKAFPLGEWVFVAGVVDNDAGAIRIYQNDDAFEASGLKIGKPSALTVAAPGSSERKHYIFIGADDFNSGAKENRHVALDDVRLYGDALSPDALKAVRRAGESRIAVVKDRNPAPASVPEDTGKAIDRSGAPTELPEDVRQTEKDAPQTKQAAQLPSPGPKLEGPAPVERTPDQGLSIPEGLPGQTIEDEIEAATDAPPPPEAGNEIFCEEKFNTDADLTSTPRAFPSDFMLALMKAKSCDLDLTVVSINNKGEWIVSTSDQVAHSRDLAAPLLASLATAEKKHGGLDAADISESGAFLLSADGELYDSGLTPDAKRKAQMAAGGGGLKYFDFHPSDPSRWVVIDSEGTVSGGNLPSGILKALADLPTSKREVRQIRFGPGERWALLGSGSWVVTDGIDEQILAKLEQSQDQRRALDHIVFAGQANAYAIYSADRMHMNSSDEINKLEQGFQYTAVRNGRPESVLGSIWARMDAHNLKAVSIAFIQDNKISWARGYGLRNGDEPESYVYADTTFEAASLSKPIAALGLLQLVEAGKLSLTGEGVLQDIERLMTSSERKTFRQNVRPEKGNLIQLLQHCASICYQYNGQCTAPGGSGGGAEEYGVTASLPDTADMILGGGNADPGHKLIRTGNPGLFSSYTSANYLAVQALIDVHGNGFENHIQPILNALDMTDSTYKSPYPKRNDGNHVRGWNGSSVTPFVAYGEMAAASIVSTPVDMAKFVIEVNKSAENPGRNGLLSYNMVQKYLGRDSSIYQSDRYAICNNPSSYGLGVNHTNSSGDWAGTEAYWHTGSHNGYRARMIGLPKKSSGIVVFASGTRDDADDFFDELQGAVMRAYGSVFQ